MGKDEINGEIKNLQEKLRKIMKRVGILEKEGKKPPDEPANQEPEELMADEETDQAEARDSAIETVRLAREIKRPTTYDYIRYIIKDFIELHGDRRFSDDQAIVGGVGFLKNIPVTIIGHQKGRNVKENIKRYFGMAHPEGYRKALRLMQEAEKFQRPIINLIDTPGAYPGLGAEERGQAEAIAYNLYQMSGLKTPIISIVTGEGGSGGALALSVADRIFMLSNSIYSVISPEGCASILWKDAGKADAAAEALKIRAEDLLKFGIIDDIIEEPRGGAHLDPKNTAENLKKTVYAALKELLEIPPGQLLSQRYEKYRKMGVFIE